MNKHQTMTGLRLSCAAVVLTLTACASPDQAPATADVAVSRHAVENAVSAGAADLAPAEITAARDKMIRANQALAAARAQANVARAAAMAARRANAGTSAIQRNGAR